MALFVDWHSPGEMPFRVLQHTLLAVDQVAASPGSARLVDYVVGEQAGLFCVLEAPNKEAALRWHIEQGIQLRCSVAGAERESVLRAAERLPRASWCSRAGARTGTAGR